MPDPVTLIVPTLCVGMQPGTLRVPFQSWNAERPLRHSHAERGNDRYRHKKTPLISRWAAFFIALKR
ncbi:hypothetical protein PSUM_03095 [Pseudomonas umsongensis]|uniref:Uncharacterized protein n=1 Tax=Pseudomonas umsongensis TaxID=198618 RepID=A0ABX4DZS4_9PSED|nr:hypothetical protein PSUM_03095 [Pseudomonas umsongensis]